MKKTLRDELALMFVGRHLPNTLVISEQEQERIGRLAYAFADNVLRVRDEEKDEQGKEAPKVGDFVTAKKDHSIYLTGGKKYQILEIGTIGATVLFSVIDDRGITEGYYARRFHK